MTMKFFSELRENKYTFQLTEAVSVELSLQDPPYYSSIRVMNEKTELSQYSLSPENSNKLFQYYVKNQKEQLPSEMFIEKLTEMGLDNVATAVTNAISPVQNIIHHN